ncbi:TolC family protein [Sediminicola luteus]|uniref:Transporter n=1 Tax=Sediminicola luteus TaxID=319238 RepID=A0A2A4G684_9FLAO|nr:TolC family protein [Sediminicola luteus]PCE63255.1 transporter [Sediminicola luteus]
MNLKTIVAGVFILVGLSLQAQTKRWTLEECIAYAEEHNISLAQSELDLENAKIDKSDALGGLLPSLNGSMGGTFSSGLSQNPVTGINTRVTNFSANGGLSSGVNLFDGLRNYKRLDRAKLNALAAEYRLEDMKDDIRLAVANAYLRILMNKEALKVAKAQLAVTEKDIERTKELVESGVVPRGDQLELEATAANQLQQVVSSENEVVIAKLSLAQLLQLEDYNEFAVVDEQFEVPPSDILNNSAKDIFNKAMEVRNDIKLSAASVDLAVKDVEIAKGAYYPTLRGFVNYNTNYFNNNRYFNPDGSLGDKIPFKEQLWMNDGIAYGASLNIPIFNGWSAKNGVKRSRISLDKARLQLEQDKLDLEATVNRAYTDTKGSFKTYEAAEKTLEARRLSHQYAQERFNVGLMNAFEYSQAQARVDDAAASVIRSKFDYIFKLKVLEFYFGLPITLE